VFSKESQIIRVKEVVSSCLTAHQHKICYLVPYQRSFLRISAL